MKLTFLSIAVGLLIALSTTASANRRYFLVGVRHVYKVAAYPDPSEMDRQAIEETYSSAIANAQQQYNKDMSSIATEEANDGGNKHQADRDAVQQNLEADIATAADARDASLSLIYVQDDKVRIKHPQLAVDQDGPYKLMAIDTGPSNEFVDVIYYRPYPLYVDPCPFGWGWGVAYPYATFGVMVTNYHSTWISFGCPVFGGLFIGGVAFDFVAPIRRDVIINHSRWIGGRPPMISAHERTVLVANHQLQVQKGVFHASSTRSGSTSPRSKYSRTGTGSTGSSTRTGSGTTGSSAGTRSDTSRTSTRGSSSSKTSKYVRPPVGSSSRGTDRKSGGDDKKRGG